MSHELAISPLFLSIARGAAQLYARGKIPLDTDALVVFTCGAESAGPSSAREQLLRYAERYFKHGSFFRAEDAFPVLLRSIRDDYLSIEERIADYSDCVVIINESPGALAELGAFASNDKVVGKLLVVNPQAHLGQKSFINLGPIAKADKKSIFRTTIHADMNSVSLHFDTILKRIETKAVRRYRLGVDFSQPKAWKQSRGKLRLLLLQDVLNLFCPITVFELESVMNLFFPGEYVRFPVELGLLKATRKVQEQGDVLLTAISCVQHSFDVPHRPWLGLRKRLLDVYRSKDPSRLRLLTQRSSEAP